MAEPPNDPDTGHDVDGDLASEGNGGKAPWQKVVGIIGLLVVLGLAILIVAGGGEHGPGRHAPGGDEPGIDEPAGEAPPAGDHAPPEGGHGN